MNRQRAQVFIATTNGLVQVQSISPLSNPDLHSVATIGNTSQLAGISSLYRDYVERPQGLISDLFDDKAYRLNLSNGIDQGESWQLGVFIAHYLFHYDCLSDGNGRHVNGEDDTNSENLAKDIIFIATGKVDTLHYHVLPIDELAKKCRHANVQIAQWQSIGHQICYLAPTHNFRQAIVDSIIKLTPIAHLRELYHLCKLYGLSSQVLSFPDSLGSIDTEFIDNINTSSVNQKDIVDASFTDDKQSLIANDIDDRQSGATSKISIFSWLLLVLLTVTVTSFLWFVSKGGNTSTSTNDIELAAKQKLLIAPVEYIVSGDISQNRAMCLSAKRALISHGKFSVNSESNATNLSNLCSMFVTTSRKVDKLWLVSDTKAIIELKGIKIEEQALSEDSLPMVKELLQHEETLIQWSVPIPQNREQTRRFTLLAFLQTADEADLSSLDRYLFQLHQQGKEHSMKDLQIWINKTQTGKQVLMLEQELSIYQ